MFSNIILLFTIFCISGTICVPARYDQRQEGQLNVHARLDNVLVMLVPTFSLEDVTKIPSWLQYITKSAVVPTSYPNQNNEILGSMSNFQPSGIINQHDVIPPEPAAVVMKDPMVNKPLKNDFPYEIVPENTIKIRFGNPKPFKNEEENKQNLISEVPSETNTKSEPLKNESSLIEFEETKPNILEVLAASVIDAMGPVNKPITETVVKESEAKPVEENGVKTVLVVPVKSSQVLLTKTARKP